MDRWLKGFIAVSLLSLFAGGTLGIVMLQTHAGAAVLFAHVHLLLIGFMSFMVFGVGYFILPRFNATTLRFPGWVAVHFTIATVGLLAMVVGQTLAGGTGKPVVASGAALELAGFAMFALNLLMSLRSRPEHAEEPQHEPRPKPATVLPAHPGRFTADTPIGELLRLAPAALDVLVRAGLTPLADPAHRAMVAERGLTVGYACERHGIDVHDVLSEIELTSTPAAPVLVPSMIIGDVLAAFPPTRAVFRRYFGEGCFSCPGQAQETVAQAALMHNVPPELLLSELRRAAGR